MGNDKNKSTFAYNEQGTAGENTLLSLPSSPALNAINDVLKYSDKLSQYSQRKNSLSHGKTKVTIYQPTPERPTWGIQTESETHKTFIEITDINQFTQKNRGAKKFFRLVLSKVCHLLKDGKLTSTSVLFPIDEMVDNKAYSKRANAKRGFEQCQGVLASLKISGKVYKKGKKELLEDSYIIEEPADKKEAAAQTPPKTEKATTVVLFPYIDINKENQCIVDLNPRVNWGAIIQFFSILPQYYMELPFLAGELLEFIFLKARQKTEQIAKKGYFDINMREIQYALNLPNEDKVIKPKRDITNKIDEAMTQIEEKQLTYYPVRNKEKSLLQLTILPEGIDNKGIKNFLDTGFMRVHLRGIFKQPFIKIEDNKNRKIIKYKQRKESNIDRAKIQAKADELKEKGGGKNAEN